MLNRFLKTGFVTTAMLLVSATLFAQQTGRVLLVTQPSVSTPAKPVAAPASVRTVSAPAQQTRDIPAQTPASSTVKKGSIYLLKAGDPLVVYLLGIPDEQQIEDIIDENGYINLPYIGLMQAAEKTSSGLELDIEKAYSEKQIYKRLSVNVIVPTRSYYVRGEVKAPGRFPLMSGISVVQAIAASGGYTDFADPTKVIVVRGGKKIYVNMRELEKNPEKDMDVEAGDVIIVSRSFF